MGNQPCCLPNETGNGVDSAEDSTVILQSEGRGNRLGGAPRCQVNGVWPMFLQETPVEYFSATHRQWLPGSLELRLLPGSAEREPQVVYNVRINTGGNRVQVRKNIAPSSFRLPLAPGEAVEIVSKVEDKWTPCIIDDSECPTTHQGRDFFGYSIRLHTGAVPSKRVFKKVPAARLRRRFLEGDRVNIYQGVAKGWTDGQVDSHLLPMDAEQEGDLLELGQPIVSATLSTSSLTSQKTIMPSSMMSENRISPTSLRGSSFSSSFERIDEDGIPSSSPRDSSPHAPSQASSPRAESPRAESSPFEFDNLLDMDTLWPPVPVRGLNETDSRMVPGYLVYRVESLTDIQSETAGRAP